MSLMKMFLHRNRPEPRRTVFDSEEVFRSKHIKSVVFLEDEDCATNQLFLYDFSDYYSTLSGGIIIPHPLSKNQFENTNYFKSWFSMYFHKDSCEKQNVLVEVDALLEKQLEVYINRVTSQNTVTLEEKKHRILQWEELTTILLWEIFCKEYFNQDLALSRDILKRALWGISRCKEDVLYPQKRFDSTTIILYNFWGQSYARQRAELLKNPLGLTEEQKALINIDENKEFFNLKYCMNYEAKACIPRRRKEFYIENEIQAMLFLEELFNDYVKRLRQAGIYDDKETILAIQQWGDVTKSEIKRISFIDKISQVLFLDSHTLTPDFRDSTISMEDYDIIIRISSLADICILKADGLINDYINLVKGGGLVKPWSDKLVALRIDYRGLYSDLIKEKVISPSFDFAALKDAFQSADFSLMMESARYMDTINQRAGNAGCVQQLIKYVGERVGNEWYCLAAESSYLNSNSTKHKGENAKKAIDKLKPTKRYDIIWKIYASRIQG